MIEVKICGLCRGEDAAAAVRAGADYIGVILTPGTRRSQSLGAAAQILEAGAGARRVGVFVDAGLEEMQNAIAACSLQVVQLHGQESPELVRALQDGVEVWKAVALREPADLDRAASRYAEPTTLLLDAFQAGVAGGTGTSFSWEAFTSQRHLLSAQRRVVLAGGLTPENVGQAIRLLAPNVVDTSSGVEQSLGEKSFDRMLAFVTAARTLASAVVK
jgi:phosphoribosylanthranilate isomerase